MNPDQKKAILDAIALLSDVITTNPAAGLTDARKLLEDLVIEAPPIDAASLDPSDRAAADEEAAKEIADKFGK